MVMSIDPQGPGAAAGVRQGDVIVAWNSEPVRHVHSLLRALGPDSVGQTVTLGLRRAGEPVAGSADHRREARRLSETIAPNPVRLALALADAALADRLAALLTGVPGLRLGQRERDGRRGRSASPDPSPAADDDVPLTPRELEVLTLLAEGASNKMIAQRLGISVHTAKFHVGSLLDKLDAIGRTDAVAHAARLGVIHL